MISHFLVLSLLFLPFVDIHTIKCARVPGNSVTFWTPMECLCPASQKTRSFVPLARGPYLFVNLRPSHAVCTVRVRPDAVWDVKRQAVSRQVFALFLCSTASFYTMSKSLVSHNSGICRYKLADWRALVNKPGTYWGVFWNCMQKCCI
jgi:hypothetical protein